MPSKSMIEKARRLLEAHGMRCEDGRPRLNTVAVMPGGSLSLVAKTEV